MEAFWFALSFLTRLPIAAAPAQPDAATLQRGRLFLPLVGGLIGLSTALLVLLLARGISLPLTLAVALALAFEARLTGAMHEDAVADCADALGGGWSRERTLEILRDSRLGSYGVLALVLGILLRLLALTALAGGLRLGLGIHPLRWCLALFFAGYAGRLQMLLLLRAVPPAPGRSSLSEGIGAGGWGRDLWVCAAGLILPALALGTLSFWSWLVWGAGALALHRWACRTAQVRLGGSTGDLLGAVAFAGQLLCLVSFAIEPARGAWIWAG